MAEKKMIIDGVSCPFTTERNVLEVARNNGIDIPSLCYCENLSIYGGCRLCLVENDRGKMDAACSMQPRDGMVVNTHTKQVLDSRRTTLQLLMSSHRADCLTSHLEVHVIGKHPHVRRAECAEHTEGNHEDNRKRHGPAFI